MRQLLECARLAAAFHWPSELLKSPSEPTVLAARPNASTLSSRNVLRNRRHVQKATFLRSSERLAVVQRGLLKLLVEANWQVEAWSIFSNHYHFIAHSPQDENAENLSAVLRELHSRLAIWINRLDKTPNRTIWHNFWETRLTFQRSYLARLNYVHQNAVHHGLVTVANQYPWCSAAWLERASSPAQVKSVYAFKIDSIKVHDEYEPSAEW